jgi:signal transduction histidine kinase
VVKGLRALAQKAELQLTQVDIGDAAEEIVALLRGEFERARVVLELDLPRAPMRILGDRVQLQQVLLNLIRNGIEAMTATHDRPRRLKISVEYGESAQAVVIVADSGSGLDPATAQRIFDPLFTTKPHGMGMGLSVCRSIIEAHHGRLWASPNFPNGTIFQFTVPLLTGGDDVRRPNASPPET